MELVAIDPVPPGNWPGDDFEGRRVCRAFAWVLSDVKPLAKSVPYDHPSGAVIWVTLADIVARQILQEMERSQ